MRARIAAGLIITAALISAFLPIHLQALRVAPANEVLVFLDRARCLQGALPEGVQTFGFTPPIDYRPADAVRGFDTADSLRRLFLMRYSLAPRLVSDTIIDSPWVIAAYPDSQSGTAHIRQSSWQIIKNCENGIFLLKKAPDGGAPEDE